MKEKNSIHTLADLYTLIPGAAAPEEKKSSGKNPLQKLLTLHVVLEKKGRKGKGVTVISGFHHTQADLLDLARTLKTTCGSGGTVKEDTVEIQGDHRDKIASHLRELGYTVKVRK